MWMRAAWRWISVDKLAVVQNTSQGLTRRISIWLEPISACRISEDLFLISEQQSAVVFIDTYRVGYDVASRDYL